MKAHWKSYWKATNIYFLCKSIYIYTWPQRCIRRYLYVQKMDGHQPGHQHVCLFVTLLFNNTINSVNCAWTYKTRAYDCELWMPCYLVECYKVMPSKTALHGCYNIVNIATCSFITLQEAWVRYILIFKKEKKKLGVCHLKAHNNYNNAVQSTGSYELIMIKTSLVYSCILNYIIFNTGIPHCTST